jgi:hypothetical protein
MMQTGNVGDPCVSDTDCAAVDTSDMNGGPAFCDKQEIQILPGATQATPGHPYPGGYCTRQCYASSQCGTGFSCGFYGGFWGEALNICYKMCDVDTDCRSGYSCLAILSTSPSGFCIPSNLPDGGIGVFDAGPGPARSTIGKNCTKDTDCQTETKYGFCLKGTLPDGGMSGYGTGECIADCTMTADDGWCMGLPEFAQADGGARCDAIAVNDQNGAPLVEWECKKGCTTAADCKAGYHCAADGFGDNVCEPNCDNPGAANTCGAMGCLTSWGCFTATCNATTHDCGM